MTTLYLDRRDTRLRLEGRALAIYTDDQRRGTVPINLLESVVMRSAVTLESSLLANLADAGVSVLIFGGRNASKLAQVHGRAHNDGARRIGQLRRVDDPAWCLAWTRRLVSGKLRRQQRLLQSALTERADQRLRLRKAIVHLQQARRRAVDPEVRRIDSLRGIEGAGAAAYFNAYCALFPPELAFTGRNRRPPRDPVNAVLSLSYTLLHAEAVRACYGAGLDPIIGYYHTLDFGRESLASDLIEPLRPLVDAWVWDSTHGPSTLPPAAIRVSRSPVVPSVCNASNAPSSSSHCRALRACTAALRCPGAPRPCWPAPSRASASSSSAMPARSARDCWGAHLNDLGFGRNTELGQIGEPSLARDLAELLMWYLEPPRIGWLRRRFAAARHRGEVLRLPRHLDAVRLFESRAARISQRGRDITNSLHRWLISET